MSFIDELTPEQIARVRERYESGEATVAAIAREEGLSEHKIRALRSAFGWTPRLARKRPGEKAAKRKATRSKGRTTSRTAKARSAKRARTNKPIARAKGLTTAEMIVRIRALLEQALGAAQARLGEDLPDATARFTNNLGRALATLKALEKDSGKDAGSGERDDGSPLDLAELRRELARRIDRLRQDREAS